MTRDGGQAGEGSGLLVFEAAQLGHGGDELIGGQRAKAADAGQDFVASGEFGVCGDEGCDLGIEGFDMVVDLIEALLAVAFQDGDREVLLAVLKRGAIADQAIAGVDQLG